jgi:general stress protein 26
MMTTRRPDGHLESRAMANQKRADGADLWFVTAEGTVIVAFLVLSTGVVVTANVPSIEGRAQRAATAS